jgi:hypothetical protein
MFLEYDWTSNAYRAHVGDAFTSIVHSFETLAAARHALRLVGLRLGTKTDARTWRIELMGAESHEDMISSASASMGTVAHRNSTQSRAAIEGTCRALMTARSIRARIAVVVLDVSGPIGPTKRPPRRKNAFHPTQRENLRGKKRSFDLLGGGAAESNGPRVGRDRGDGPHSPESRARPAD